MLTHFREAVGTWVFAKDTETPEIPLGKVYDLVIDPANGKIEGLWVKTGFGLRLVLPKDIIHWNQAEVLIGDEGDLSEADGLPALRKVLDKEVEVVGARVYGKIYGKYLGKVRDFAFHTTAPVLANIEVRSGWWVFGKSRIISQGRIVEIRSDGIWVSDQMLEREEETVSGAEQLTD